MANTLPLPANQVGSPCDVLSFASGNARQIARRRSTGSFPRAGPGFALRRPLFRGTAGRAIDRLRGNDLEVGEVAGGVVPHPGTHPSLFPIAQLGDDQAGLLRLADEDAYLRVRDHDA